MKKIILFSLLVLSCSIDFETGTGKKYALIYGINTYQHISPLKYSVNDALSISSFLKQNSFEVTLRTNSLATKENFSNDILSIISNLKEEDTLIFFYSGHGYRTNSLSYIVPYDATLSSIESFISEVELFNWLKDSKTEKILLIFDKCFAGAYIAHKKYFVITSSDEGEESLEIESIQHGLLTYYLLTGLENKRADINNDRYVSFAELFYFAKYYVTNYYFTDSFGKYTNQNPQFLGKTNIEYILY